MKSLGDKRRGMTKSMPRGKNADPQRHERVREHGRMSFEDVSEFPDECEAFKKTASEFESNVGAYDVTSE